MKSRQEKIKALAYDFRTYFQQLQEGGAETVMGSGVKPGGKEKKEAASEKAPATRPPAGLPELEEEIRNCRKCRLAETRNNAVPGEGGNSMGVMLIGEGPGANEDRLGRPFVGRAGELLDKILTSIGLSRKEVYITNIVKCRPPGNRDPKNDEVSACWPYLERQIELLKPRVIVSLGSPAVKALLETETGISRLRGQFHDYEGIPLLPTYHPAYLLRSYTVDNRRKVWEDMKMVKEFLEKGDTG